MQTIFAASATLLTSLEVWQYEDSQLTGNENVYADASNKTSLKCIQLATQRC